MPDSMNDSFRKALSPSKEAFLCHALCGEEPKPDKQYNWDCFLEEEDCESTCFGQGCAQIKTCKEYNDPDYRIHGGKDGDEDEIK